MVNFSFAASTTQHQIRITNTTTPGNYNDFIYVTAFNVWENILVPDNYTITQLTVKETQYIAVPDAFNVSNLSVTATPYPDVAYVHQLNVSYAKPYTRPLCANNNDKLTDINKQTRGFNGHERDDEVYGEGNLNSAMFWEYDTRLGRRWNIDPVSKSWQSDYVCLSNNPVIMVDPNGDTDFYNEAGKKIGTDGINNGENFILTNHSDIKKAIQSYYGKGIKGFIAKLTGNGGKGTIQKGEFSGDVVPLPPIVVMEKIIDAVDRSNKPTDDDTKGGFHEEGGHWGIDGNGKVVVVDAAPGPKGTPGKGGSAVVNVFNPANEDEDNKQKSIVEVQGTFHVHPSGTLPSTSNNTLINTGTSFENSETKVFGQEPSQDPDVVNATQGGNTSGYNVVVGARNNTVYIHGTSNQNQPGKTYRAKFAIDAMKKIVNDKKSSSDTK